ncbi:cell division protein ZapA [Planococcus salinarum]|uniref:cell division protein ZapA n=1 Tax=Planococcus salinarum TaxID=622695 RepID=UPI000E3C4005|nr:cell division protein ZapA [Planococcus salinarum]TAA70480.1 cell division protein ZapA [Planococcus salinarum]
MSDQQRIRTSVEIYGRTYKMVGTETSGHMRLVASTVDEKMREIHAMNPSLDSSRLAVLTAVNAVHDNLKLKERIEQLETEMKKLKG